jgi:hypothetical protein
MRRGSPSRLIQGCTMSEHRAYVVGSDGHFLKAVEVICDDEDAIKQAETLVDSHDIELWHLDRQIKIQTQGNPQS